MRVQEEMLMLQLPCENAPMVLYIGNGRVSAAVHQFSLTTWQVSRELPCNHRWRSLLDCSQRSQSGHSKQACCWSASCRCPACHMCERVCHA